MKTKNLRNTLALLLMLVGSAAAVQKVAPPQKATVSGPTQTVKAAPPGSTEVVEECYYDENNDYQCKDAVKPIKGTAKSVNAPRAATVNAPPPAIAALTQVNIVEKPATAEELKKLEYDQLIRKREALQKVMKDLNEKQDALRQIRFYLPQLRSARIDGAPRQVQIQLETVLAEPEQALGLAPGESDSLSMETIISAIQRDETDLRTVTEELGKVDAEISHRVNIEAKAQMFKTWMSILFAVIVAMVIVGFFVVVRSDPEVLRTVFSAETGIQFITLFSLVIAIILFGITGVLDGKELAALLGGLAGYILGRSGIGTPRGFGRRPPQEAPPGDHEAKLPHAA